jgi:hypothetical protein
VSPSQTRLGRALAIAGAFIVVVLLVLLAMGIFDANKDASSGGVGNPHCHREANGKLLCTTAKSAAAPSK